MAELQSLTAAALGGFFVAVMLRNCNAAIPYRPPPLPTPLLPADPAYSDPI